MKVTHCPTREMWADVLTKPLQGRAFRLMRLKLMNCSVDYENEQLEEEESRKQRIATKANQKLGKSKPVTGRMSLWAPTQTLLVAAGGAVAADDNDAVGTVVPPSSTKDEDAYVGASVAFKGACVGAFTDGASESAAASVLLPPRCRRSTVHLRHALRCRHRR